MSNDKMLSVNNKLHTMSEQAVSGTTYEPWVCQIQSTSVNHSTATLNVKSH